MNSLRRSPLHRYWALYWIVVRDQVEFLGPRSWFGKSAVCFFSLLPGIAITWRLIKFDHLIREKGMVVAADWLLKRYYSGYAVSQDHTRGVATQAVNHNGELLFANHVGLADVLALLSWRGRTDVYIITKERALLRALPALNRHVVSIGTRPADRRRMLDRTVELLSAGAQVIVFPAGRIENDPWFLTTGEIAVSKWSGLLGYLIGRGRKQGDIFTLQPVLTGNVYAPASRYFYSAIEYFTRKTVYKNDKNKYLAFFTFIFRLSRNQPVRLIPDKHWNAEDIPAEYKGKKALTEFLRQRLILLADTVSG